MGFFHRKKKSTVSPIPPPVASFGLAPEVPIKPAAPEPPRVTLRVLVDSGPESRDLFYIKVRADEGVAAIRRAVSAEIGVTSMSIFKVSIPWQAHYQARAYTDRYGCKVDLVTSFPSYNLDDESQLGPSLGPGWQRSTDSSPLPTVAEWFPQASAASSDNIAVIVRTSSSSSSSSSTTPPLTLVAHFALPGSEPTGSRRARTPSTPTPNAVSRRPPVVVDVSPNATIEELKVSLLAADGRPATMLDRVIIWHVEMSETEMIVIEERGGLKRGQMPWPYPPTAPVPVALTEMSAPVSKYFPGSFSNARMVSLSVWIHPAAVEALKRIDDVDEDTPSFQYPMPVSAHLGESGRKRLSISRTSPVLTATTSGLPVLPLNGDLDLAQSSGSSRRRNMRPSTAPSFTSPFGSPKVAPPAFGESKSVAPAFGSRSLGISGGTSRRPRTASPLSDFNTIPEKPLTVVVPRSNSASEASASEDEVLRTPAVDGGSEWSLPTKDKKTNIVEQSYIAGVMA